MAAIDKIYGSLKQWLELRKFLRKTKPEYIAFMYDRPTDKTYDHFPLSNFSTEANIFLINNCHLQFVLRRIKEQYGEYWYKNNKIEKVKKNNWL